MASKLAIKDVEKLEQLHGEYRDEPNETERAKRRNRLGCFVKTLIRRTNTSAGLECIHILMSAFDPKKKFGPPVVFPTSLWSHLESKIADYRALERKPITDAERRARKAQRREGKRPQEQVSVPQFTPTTAQAQ
jgi:hypothetical protein